MLASIHSKISNKADSMASASSSASDLSALASEPGVYLKLPDEKDQAHVQNGRHWNRYT